MQVPTVSAEPCKSAALWGGGAGSLGGEVEDGGWSGTALRHGRMVELFAQRCKSVDNVCGRDAVVSAQGSGRKNHSYGSLSSPVPCIPHTPCL